MKSWKVWYFQGVCWLDLTLLGWTKEVCFTHNGCKVNKYLVKVIAFTPHKNRKGILEKLIWNWIYIYFFFRFDNSYVKYGKGMLSGLR